MVVDRMTYYLVSRKDLPTLYIEFAFQTCNRRFIFERDLILKPVPERYI